MQYRNNISTTFAINPEVSASEFEEQLLEAIIAIITTNYLVDVCKYCHIEFVPNYVVLRECSIHKLCCILCSKGRYAQLYIIYIYIHTHAYI